MVGWEGEGMWKGGGGGGRNTGKGEESGRGQGEGMRGRGRGDQWRERGRERNDGVGERGEGSTLTCQHLQEKSSKAKDVHFGGLLGGVVGFRRSIAGATGTNGCQIVLKVNCAIVRHFGSPATIRQRLKEDIRTADVTMNERVWLHQVEVVEGSQYIKANGDGRSN